MISLCMIVRDEAEMLPRFLECARGLWDELCVVDTGSRDLTVDLLTAAGARVIHRPWDDDFSAARNASLGMATGDWVVNLDADEMVTPAFIEDVRRVANDATVGAATVFMRNEFPGGNRRESRLLRLWRRDPSVRFRFPIHEDASEAVLSMLARDGKKLVHLAGAVDHLGYSRDRAAARDKKTRDVTILNTCIAREPADLYSRFKLLEAARFWQDEQLLADSARATLRILESAGPAALKGKHFGGDLLVLMARGLYGERDVLGVLHFLNRWADAIVPSAAFLVRRGELWECAGDGRRAAADFTRCFELRGSTADLQMATVRPHLGLARLAIASRDLWQAWQHTEQALAHNPRDPEGLLSALLICKTAGGNTGIDEFAAAYVARHGQSDELKRALAEARDLAPLAA